MRFIQAIPELLSRIPQIEDVTDNLLHHVTKKWKVRKPEEIDEILIHHMASEHPLENQAKYHVNTKGWAGLGYHIVISGGKIMQTNDLMHETAHCRGHNNHTIGICIHGDLTKRSITDLERELVAAAIVMVKRLLPIKDIKGHNDYVATSCPSTSVARIKEEVAALEQYIEFAKTPEKQAEAAYRIANEILYLYNLSKGIDAYGKPVDQDRAEKAQRRLLQLEPEMKRLRFLA